MAAELGNPFAVVARTGTGGRDRVGRVRRPETFVVDAGRPHAHRHVGP